MPNNSGSLFRRPGARLFQSLFVVAAVFCSIVTYVALVRSSPTAPIPPEVQLLLVANGLILVILSWIVVRRYIQLRAESLAEGGGRLARRFMLLFGLSAMIPALIVSLFLWASVANGIDELFGERVVTLVEDTASVARDNVAEYVTNFEDDTRLMAVDVNNAAEGFQTDRPRFEAYLGIQAYLRNIPAAYIISADGRPEAVAENMVETGFFRRPTAQAFADADAGEAVVSLQESAGFASSLVRLTDFDGSYLYLAKPLDVGTFRRLRRAEEALLEYRQAEQRSALTQTIFAVAYIQIVLLVLLLSVRIAQEFASRLSAPISRLAQAAALVSEGSGNVQVPLPDGHDEVRTLSQSFNIMTGQLDERRQDLERARIDADERREFVETLLAEVSAGVMQVDERGVVTLANRSAGELLGQENIEGMRLEDASPSFMAMVRQTLDTGEPTDASVDMAGKSGIRHFRVKATRNLSGGLVMTFDDTTRLVNAQRQLAWRDVARRIAHEIRNPLTPIQLSTERLRRRYADKVDDPDGVFHRCIETIMRQVSDIGRMVQEFSDFARMPKPSPERFDIAKLIEEVTFSQHVVSPEVNVVQTASNVEIEVFGDRRLLGQAFGNIVKNSAEAIMGLPEDDEREGLISVALSHDDGQNVEIVITDNGPGFSPDLIDQYLEPYVTTREKGMGLGLAIVNRIIIDHGGVVDLQSRADGQSGAVVRVVLPIRLSEGAVSNLPNLESV
ncbi:MAG: ATP-binding protein [Pseudomonadota bacterium]